MPPVDLKVSISSFGLMKSVDLLVLMYDSLITSLVALMVEVLRSIFTDTDTQHHPQRFNLVRFFLSSTHTLHTTLLNGTKWLLRVVSLMDCCCTSGRKEIFFRQGFNNFFFVYLFSFFLFLEGISFNFNISGCKPKMDFSNLHFSFCQNHLNNNFIFFFSLFLSFASLLLCLFAYLLL